VERYEDHPQHSAPVMVNSRDAATLQTEDVPLPDPSFTQTPTPNVEQPPVDHTPIETAEDGRRYDMWPGESFSVH
jgi:hypothetical protein